MARELNDKELEKSSGGVGSRISQATFDALGLTYKDRSDTCDSFTPDHSLFENLANGGSIESCKFCSMCVYAAYVGLGFDVGIACMLKK